MRKVRLDRVKRFFERLLTSDFTRHQEAQCFLNVRVIGYVDQSFVDYLCPCFRRDVGAKVCGRLTDGVDISR